MSLFQQFSAQQTHRNAKLSIPHGLHLNCGDTDDAKKMQMILSLNTIHLKTQTLRTIEFVHLHQGKLCLTEAIQLQTFLLREFVLILLLLLTLLLVDML